MIMRGSSGGRCQQDLSSSVPFDDLHHERYELDGCVQSKSLSHASIEIHLRCKGSFLLPFLLDGVRRSNARSNRLEQILPEALEESGVGQGRRDPEKEEQGQHDLLIVEMKDAHSHGDYCLQVNGQTALPHVLGKSPQLALGWRLVHVRRGPPDHNE